MSTDKHDSIYWEHKFTELFNQDNVEGCTPHFEYDDESASNVGREAGRFSLRVLTYNPKKDASFLLVDIKGKFSRMDAAQAAYNEFVTMRNGDGYGSYTVEWFKKDESKMQVSYFNAKTPMDVLVRLYSEMGVNNAVFHSLRRNPVS